MVLYKDEGLLSSYSTYELKQQLHRGKEQLGETCLLYTCSSTYKLSGTVEYIIIVNQTVTLSDIMNNIPLLNIDESFVYTVEVLEYFPSYTIKIRYTLLKQTSSYDGFSFYNPLLPNSSPYIWYNLNCTNVSIVSFGGIPLSRSGYQFYTLLGLSISPNTSPTILSDTSASNMFFNCTQFNPIQLNWNMSSIVSMERMLYGCMAFNPEPLLWNTSSVTNMDYAFFNCTSFAPVSLSFAVDKVTSMKRTFYNCTSINVNIQLWNVIHVTDMTEMFYNCSSWELDLQNWPVYVGALHSGFNTGSFIAPPHIWD